MSENSSSLVCWSVSASTSQIRLWTSSDSSKTGLKFALALSPKRAGPDAATTAPDASTSNVAILASMPRSRSAAYLRRVRARVSRVERDDRPRPDAPRASAGDRSASPPETEHFGRRRAVRDVDVRLRRSGGLAERVLGARVQQRLRELGRPRDEVPERERALALQRRVPRVAAHRVDDERAAVASFHNQRAVLRPPQRHHRERGDDVLADDGVGVHEPLEAPEQFFQRAVDAHGVFRVVVVRQVPQQAAEPPAPVLIRTVRFERVAARLRAARLPDALDGGVAFC
mmetsp:Transcript_5469/g.17271  ORF Transcript_5469/g.17271 Transcript_5469/m.17271 type:complete len:286 (+) Transcript_5469:194-1051(+)